MSNAKSPASHTPGPWINADAQKFHVSYEGIPLGHAEFEISAGGSIVALGMKYGKHAQANARLIAAAPELLEACEEAFVALPMAKHNEPINARLKAAIAKAKHGDHTAEARSTRSPQGTTPKWRICET